MKIYCKVWLPEGKRVRLINQATKVVDRKNAVVLYPDRATEVDNELGRALMAQDPHLVSTKPCKKPKKKKLIEVEVDEDERPITGEEMELDPNSDENWEQDGEPEHREPDEESDPGLDGSYAAPMRELSDMGENIVDLSFKECKRYAKELGTMIPVGTSKKEAVKILLKRMDELA